MDNRHGNALISDFALWFKHIEDNTLRGRLAALADDEEITLVADSVVGRWQRMRQGKNPQPTEGLRPVGAMKDIWKQWFETRKGEWIWIREAEEHGDDYLAAGSALFSEWLSAEDEEAFRDL